MKLIWSGVSLQACRPNLRSRHDRFSKFCLLLCIIVSMIQCHIKYHISSIWIKIIRVNQKIAINVSKAIKILVTNGDILVYPQWRELLGEKEVNILFHMEIHCGNFCWLLRSCCDIWKCQIILFLSEITMVSSYTFRLFLWIMRKFIKQKMPQKWLCKCRLSKYHSPWHIFLIFVTSLDPSLNLLWYKPIYAKEK